MRTVISDLGRRRAGVEGEPQSGLRRNDGACAQRLNRLPHFATIAENGPRLFGRFLIKLYQYTLSSLVGSRCRHLPTCSEYADQAVGRFGLWAGGWMTLARLLRCHPWGSAGLDFVPDELPAQARWYLPWRYGRWRGVNEHPHDCPA